MMKITTELNEKNLMLSVVGHAGYAKLGQDIVCSAVSVLTHLLFNSLENFEMKSNHLEPSVMFIAETTEKNVTLFKAVTGELFFLQQSYPQYVEYKGGEWK